MLGLKLNHVSKRGHRSSTDMTLATVGRFLTSLTAHSTNLCHISMDHRYEKLIQVYIWLVLIYPSFILHQPDICQYQAMICNTNVYIRVYLQNKAYIIFLRYEAASTSEILG